MAIAEFSQANAGGVTPDQLKEQHPAYARKSDDWTYTDVHYDAQRLYQIDNLTEYVPQKHLGEADEAYSERLKITAYMPLLAAVLDSIVGGVARKDSESDRKWGVLERESVNGTPVKDVLLKDADRNGTSWAHFQLRKLTSGLVFNETFTLIDTTGVDGRPFIALIPPLALTNWLEDEDGRMVEALIVEVADERTSIFDPSEGAEAERYLKLTIEGWQRFRITENDDGEPIVEATPFEIWDGGPWLDREGDERLPLVKTMPRLNRYAAFELAHLANEILNLNSELRYILRAGGLGQFLSLSATDDEFSELVEGILTGVKALQLNPESANPHSFVGPDMGPVQGMLKTLVDKKESFWQASLFEFSDQAVERSATEIRADFAASIGSFLASLAEAADESENEELWLLAQAVKPGVVDSANEADIPTVQRSTDFSVEDTATVATRMRDLIFGQNNGVPITPEMAALASLAIFDRVGLKNLIEDEVGIKAELIAMIEERAALAAAAPAAAVEGDEE